MSQVDSAYDILKHCTRSLLHVFGDHRAIEQASCSFAADRESLVSALSKKVARRDRFSRPEKNTFALLPEVK